MLKRLLRKILLSAFQRLTQIQLASYVEQNRIYIKMMKIFETFIRSCNLLHALLEAPLNLCQLEILENMRKHLLLCY